MDKIKELKISIPEGYEIDKENSTFECIKFKPVVKEIKTYDDLIAGNYKIEKGFILDNLSNISPFNDIIPHRAANRRICLTEKEAKKQRAIGIISQLMPYYGGAVTDEDWKNPLVKKYVIFRIKDSICSGSESTWHKYLAFYTDIQRDMFLRENKQIIKDYLMLD